jgi:hypothetical protein
MYLTYSHYYTYIKIPASAEKICGRRVFCRKLFLVEFGRLRYNKPREFFCFGKDRDSIPDELLQFLDYVKNTGRTETIFTTDSFVRHLQDTIDAIKQNRSMEERYMLLEEMMRNEKREGIQEGIQQCLVDFLKAKFSVSDIMIEKIESETDICKLQAWFQLSLKVSSVEEFEKNM